MQRPFGSRLVGDWGWGGGAEALWLNPAELATFWSLIGQLFLTNRNGDLPTIYFERSASALRGREDDDSKEEIMAFRGRGGGEGGERARNTQDARGEHGGHDVLHDGGA